MGYRRALRYRVTLAIDRMPGRPPVLLPISQNAPVAQLDRVLPSEGRGRRFESCQARHPSRLNVKSNCRESVSMSPIEGIVYAIEGTVYVTRASPKPVNASRLRVALLLGLGPDFWGRSIRPNAFPDTRDEIVRAQVSARCAYAARMPMKLVRHGVGVVIAQ